MSRLTSIILSAAVGGLLVAGVPRSGNAREDIIVTLAQPGQTEPFAVFRCAATKPCVGDTLFEKGGVKLPLHFSMEPSFDGIAFDTIVCVPMQWHFSIGLNNGNGGWFPPGKSTGTLFLDTLGLSVEPVVRTPPGVEVGKILVGIYRADGR